MGDEGRPPLPPGIEVSWGLRERPNRGPKPALSVERIVQAAIKVAEADGLGAVSMSRVATELGTAPMSLYRHISAKNELMVLMVNAVALPAPGPLADGESWRDGLLRWSCQYLELLMRHPWVLRVPLETPPMTPNELAWLEAGLSFLRGTGLAPQQKVSVITLLGAYVRSWAGLVHDMANHATASGSTPEEAMLGYWRTLQRLVDPARFPELAEVIASGEADDEDDFRFGLDRILDGVATLIR